MRFGAAAVAAICCAILALAPQSAEFHYSEVASTRVKVTSDHGWPLPAVNRIREATEYPGWGPQGKTFSKYDLPVTATKVRAAALLYDVCLIVTLIVMACRVYLPWRDFPRFRFSLADAFVLIACLSVGSVLWYRMCLVGAELWQERRDLLGINTLCYLIVSLVSAGVLNGLFAVVGRWIRQKRSILSSQPPP